MIPTRCRPLSRVTPGGSTASVGVQEARLHLGVQRQQAARSLHACMRVLCPCWERPGEQILQECRACRSLLDHGTYAFTARLH
jgi:hypothetical protein